MAFRISSNVNGLIARNRMRMTNYSRTMVLAEKRNMQKIRGDAIKATSFTAYKTNALRPIYPYSLRHNVPITAPFFANMQSGEMSRAWRVRTTENPEGLLSSIWNEMEYSKYFDGKNTRKMVARPILQYVLLKSRQTRLEALHAEHVAFFNNKYGPNYLNNLVYFGSQWWR